MRRATLGNSSRREPRLVALAVDLDRTLLSPGSRADRSASQLLGEAQRMGLKVVLVSGREHTVLSSFSDRLRHVDALVAENGAVVEAPLGSRVRVMGRATAARVRRRLAGSHWTDVQSGAIVVSVPIETRSRLEALLVGLRVEIVPNVDRLMVLPEHISKATGMQVALRGLRLADQPFAAIGDAENDLPLLRAAELSGAVRNALPEVRASVDYVCRKSFGAGVREFVRGPLSDSLGGGRVGRRLVAREVE